MSSFIKKSVPFFFLLTACQAQPLISSSPSKAMLRAASLHALPRTLFPEVPVPPGNPITQAKVELGFRLFFEPLLSANNKMSCASCHQPQRGFSNGQANAAGVNGQRGNRNVPSIYANAFYSSLFWDGRSPSLEDQALGPIQNPIEMNESLENVVKKLSGHPYYRAKFQQTFGTPVTPQGIGMALASFERALNLQPSVYDRYLQGDIDALSPAQERGMVLFGRQAHCATCHKGVQTSDNKFHNLGVGMNLPQPDLGRFNVTHNSEDRGAFRTPSLRNITRTGPYMHDGSLRSLEEVIDFYDKGGIPNPTLSNEMNPLNLAPEDKADLLAFLEALTSEDNLREIAALPGIQMPAERLPETIARLR
ncbi:cytochrome-c peroxidase [bacterium (Candidatus Blackallbacteria) CG17_big_fil_post_rev_8_21_14_2_50_48_46]|uniref:Methylamine utilization protein MauG n=1 Tax=bacterium (Candidatus Blackallbacteria) CG17_big_fil_post_rev_8_21_14_2_50_48_46 TaxID=2014261 RepID=A0A2M7G0Y5_9BACT|nr:MAG: cytochrome-c peroxidase [bacterium (Candidatus Blackallbacteria) CG18_big_fil_WC_8_21_14_2_50_49_26]PIW15197.1 MAG: cytochrome-c peroxidase [bacterium (Candidatus Blackallbacteria) CG17_big_fil_post_rev_8_21_14_2_50_48_46]PIW44784.1 MAG: cytochrome-c peroxidase [bacterium (Candidatus Blackallbacteria) CG13_big_fil_rev_8_21_14_2_50_49_14]